MTFVFASRPMDKEGLCSMSPKSGLAICRAAFAWLSELFRARNLWLGLALHVSAFMVLGQNHPSTNRPPVVFGDFELNLPVVRLEVKEPVTSDKKSTCSVQVLYPRGVKGETNQMQATVKIHGASSQGWPKKSYSFSLEKPVKMLDMRKSSHWLLNAAYIDRSLMRHKLAYDLFLSMPGGKGRHPAAASRFVEVQFNGAYNGVYLLMERVDRQTFGLSPFQSNSLAHACIYKAVDHDADFARLGHGGYEQREPQGMEYWQPLENLNRFVKTARPQDFFNPDTGIQSYIDLDNAIDFHLLVLFASNGDGITKNYFLARNSQTNGTQSPRFVFAPWDYDGSFARNWDNSLIGEGDWLSNHLFERLLSNKAMRERYIARWNQLRQNEFSVKTMHAMIDQNVRTLGPAVKRNELTWGNSGGPFRDRLSYQEEIQLIKSWVEKRVQWLDNRFNQQLAKQP